MSAFMCSDHHFRVLAAAIVLAGVKWRKLKTPPFASRCAEFDHVASVLAKENARSVNYRYAHHGEKEVPTKHFFGGKDAQAVGHLLHEPILSHQAVHQRRGLQFRQDRREQLGLF